MRQSGWTGKPLIPPRRKGVSAAEQRNSRIWCSQRPHRSCLTGVRYYIENRQAQGWDAPLTGHGLLIWKVNFNADAWTNNAPNNSSTSGAPLHSVVSASGTKIGWDGRTDNCPKNTFPGSGKVTSWTGISTKPLLKISESNGVVTLVYIEEPVTPSGQFEITWKSGGVEFMKTTSTGMVELPASSPAACDDKVFVGWTATANYSSETTAPEFVEDGDAASAGATFYAVFATQNGGTAQVNDVMTRATTGISGTRYADWENKKLSSSAVYAGYSAGGNEAIQLRSKNENSGIVSTVSGGKLSKVAVNWHVNTQDGRTLDIYGKNSPYNDATDLYDATDRGTKLGSIAKGSSTELTIAGDYNYVGVRSNNGALYLNSLTITWGGGVAFGNYTTQCGSSQDVELVPVQQKAKKELRNGQLVIVYGDAVYSVTGARVQ